MVSGRWWEQHCNKILSSVIRDDCVRQRIPSAFLLDLLLFCVTWNVGLRKYKCYHGHRHDIHKSDLSLACWFCSCGSGYYHFAVQHLQSCYTNIITFDMVEITMLILIKKNDSKTNDMYIGTAFICVCVCKIWLKRYYINQSCSSVLCPPRGGGECCADNGM
jgi:hypothetical protein